MKRTNKISLGFVALGVAMSVAGFVCLLVAIGVLGPEFLTLIIVGGVLAGLGFLIALIASFYFEFDDDEVSDYAVFKDDEKPKRPYFGALPSLVKPKKKDQSIPPLTPATKDHIYRMTLNLGSIDNFAGFPNIRDVRSRPEKSKDGGGQNASDGVDDAAAGATGGAEKPYVEFGTTDGTKSFKD